MDKKEYKEFISFEFKLYFKNKSEFFKMLLIDNKIVKLWKLQKTIRKIEICSKKHLFKMFLLKRRKNKLANYLGIEIEPFCFGKGLKIYHPNGIIVNPNARIGENCVIVGNCCIGNVKGEKNAPIIGDNCMIGINSTIIGNIKIGNNCKIGAGAIVTKSFSDESIIVGTNQNIHG